MPADQRKPIDLFYVRKMSRPRNVVQLPPKISKTRFLSRGAVGWVYQITDQIVLKYARETMSNQSERENKIYDELESRPPLCPHIIQSFLRNPEANFLPYLPGGTLENRLQRNQRQEEGINVEVVKIEDRHLIERWTAELCAAVAWLESLELIHGDLRPTNILIDAEDHFKLIDFDSTESIGTESYGNAPPWARLRPEDGIGEGSFGFYGPKTEQFTIGSLVYNMTRGFEPYGDLDRPEGDVIDLLKDNIFPRTQEDDALDRIINRCWRGSYTSTGDLSRETALLLGAADMPTTVPLSADYCAAMRKECDELIMSGLLEKD